LLVIDGSYGEGGGQFIRTTLVLSLATGKPFRVVRARANREKLGLRKQHLTAVTAAAEIVPRPSTGALMLCRGVVLLFPQLKHLREYLRRHND
jgi:RNA 3'-terminal phosphate cyclase (ATP)